MELDLSFDEGELSTTPLALASEFSLTGANEEGSKSEIAGDVVGVMLTFVLGTTPETETAGWFTVEDTTVAGEATPLVAESVSESASGKGGWLSDSSEEVSDTSKRNQLASFKTSSTEARARLLICSSSSSIEFFLAFATSVVVSFATGTVEELAGGCFKIALGSLIDCIED